MSESTDERRERLADALCKGWQLGVVPGGVWFSALDALLEVLEPPVAEMVRRGVVEQEYPPPQPGGRWYRPAPEEPS